jgi:GDP-mannose 6-dehydrogenase
MDRRVSVIGLGYVGSVTAACLANQKGVSVIGVDKDPNKTDALAAGRSPVIEPGLDDLVRQAIDKGTLSITDSLPNAVADTAISFIAVGTPSDKDGGVNLEQVRRVIGELGKALGAKREYHVVAFRSTLLPGTIEQELIPLLEETSGKRFGQDFGVVHNPEFLREGTALVDFQEPSRTVIGSLDKRAASLVAELYVSLSAPVMYATIREAEMAKYVDNAFHALKVTFANEVGALCDEQEIDGQRIMEIFCEDKKLNLSPAYLKPGFAYGGSCLPKDLRAILHRARDRHLRLPVLEAISESNDLQKRKAIELILSTGKKRVGILGLAFKAGTDDLRESPVVELAEALVGKGHSIAIYDENVSMSTIFGSNKRYIDEQIPHLAGLLREDVKSVVADSDVIVIAQKDLAFRRLELRDNQIVIDVARLGMEEETGVRRLAIAA